MSSDEAPRGRVIGLKTKITTPRVAETQAFYERVLGMVVVETWDSPGDRGVILAMQPEPREAYLEIYAGNDADNFAGTSLQFKVDSLDAFISSLPADVPFDGPTPRPWGSTYLFLTDPNGIQVVVFSGGV